MDGLILLIGIDVMCAPVNTISKEVRQRTSAIGSAILLVKNPFLQFNDLVDLKWHTRIEIEDNTTKRHKWDGKVSSSKDKATVLLIEFAGRFQCQEEKKLYNDTVNVYCNAARLISAKDSPYSHCPRIFVILSYNYKIYFKSLTLRSDCTYVRSRHANILVAYSPSGIKAAMEELPPLFAWRDAVIDSVQTTVPQTNTHLQTIPILNTP